MCMNINIDLEKLVLLELGRSGFIMFLWRLLNYKKKMIMRTLHCVVL